MNAKDLVLEMIRQRDAGRRVKTMRSLKRQIMEALGLSEWPGFGPVKVMVGLTDYCSPSEAGVDFHRAGGDADLFHYLQIENKLRDKP